MDSLAARVERASAAAVDRDRVTATDIAALNAFCVVDAAGPFQSRDPVVARAAIEAGIHYVDLADARDFVSAFGALDESAKERGVLAVTGASSTPALSHAAIIELTRGWRRIDNVEIAITPGNRAPMGLSVIRSILSYVGKPVSVWRHGRWTIAPGWGLLTRRPISDLGRRWLSLCATPDLDLAPQRIPSVRSAVFRAGLELSFLHLGLWLLSLPVRWRWMASLLPFAEPLRDAADLFRRWGSDRGGMIVEVTGVYGDGRRLRATWTLIAEAGDGPQIPALPALCVVRALLDGSLKQRGATPCIGLVDLATLEEQFKRFAIRARRETEVLEQAPLFQRVLESFDLMPSAVRDAHAPDPARELEGRVDIEGGETFGARIIARLFGFPETGRDLPASVTIERDGNDEVWNRRFGPAEFESRVSTTWGLNRIVERFGLLEFELDAIANAAGFRLGVRSAAFMGLPLPRLISPSTVAGASLDEHGRYRFDVLVTLPLFGRLVRYEGWLTPVTSAPSP